MASHYCRVGRRTGLVLLIVCMLALQPLFPTLSAPPTPPSGT